jgi:Uma2 family endonuclease
MTATAVAAPPANLLTVEEFAALPDDGRRTELVNGEVIGLPPPASNHGYYCNNIAFELTSYVRARNLGRVLGNDSGVPTTRAPDSLRGLDVGFYSFERVPADTKPAGYWPPPELIFEVKSLSDRTKGTQAKVAEYHAAGVLVVCVLDPEAEVLAVFPRGDLPRRYTRDEVVELPEVFPDFRIPVRAFLD